jgi:YbbR domain-containing protein
MTPPSAPKKRARGAWFWWMIIALVLGAATVALISRSQKRQVEIAIGVSVDHLADNLLVANAPPPSVHLLVSGAASALQSLDPLETSCRLDLSGLGEGTHTVPVRAADIHLPKGLSLSALLTPALTIRLEALSRKSVDVFATLKGTPAPGFAVAAVTLKPDHIVIKGTRAMLAGIDAVKTRPINLENASKSFKKQVPLKLPDSIAVDPPLRIVMADIQVRERIVTRVLGNIPVAVSGAPAEFRIHPSVITLTVRGPEAIVNAITTNTAFNVSVDLNGLAPGSHSLKAVINLPVRTVLVKASPERFFVTVSK